MDLEHTKLLLRELKFDEIYKTDYSRIKTVFNPKIKNEKIVLDVGCNSGKLLEKFHTDGYTISGITNNQHLIEHIKNHNESLYKNLLNFNFEELDIDKFELRDIANFVISKRTITYTKSYGSFGKNLNKLFDLTNDGGKIFLKGKKGFGFTEDIYGSYLKFDVDTISKFIPNNILILDRHYDMLTNDISIIFLKDNKLWTKN